MTNRKGRYRNILKVAVLVTMLFNYANATMFWHCHKIGGATIMHSHIYWKAHVSGNSDGGHTQEQIQILDIICHSASTAGTMPGIQLERIDVLECVFQDEAVPEVCPVHADILSLRGPPALV